MNEDSTRKDLQLDYKPVPQPSTYGAVGYAPTVVQSTEGFVALLDVLGFRGIVAADRNNGILVKYLQTIQAVLADQAVETIVFSDSIVLTKGGTSSEDLHVLVVACSNLMGALFSERIPMRGAIAYGTFVRSQVKSSVFLAGRPIVEAYDYEQKQEWAGMLLTPSTLQQAQDVDFPITCTPAIRGDDGFEDLESQLKWKAYVQRAAIPFKGGQAHDGFAVVPYAEPSLSGLASHVGEIVVHLEWLKLTAPSPAEQSKYTNSITWLTTLRNAWSSRAQEFVDWCAKKPC